MIKCDFCVSDLKLEDAKRYEADDFVPAIDPGFHSGGAWAACPTCAALIEANKWEDLTVRSVDSYFEQHPYATIPRQMAILLIGDLHREFREHRKKGP